MSNDWQSIDKPAEGAAITFDIELSQKVGDQHFSRTEQGFAITWQGEVHAYLNHCPHAGTSLDWLPGRFFSEDGQQLVCHTHDARFNPASGDCLAGPCPRGLYSITVREHEGRIQLPTTFTFP
jgi:nitrite reductase/ring-hydroxylating ferredoxin subunit